MKVIFFFYITYFLLGDKMNTKEKQKFLLELAILLNKDLLSNNKINYQLYKETEENLINKLGR